MRMAGECKERLPVHDSNREVAFGSTEGNSCFEEESLKQKMECGCWRTWEQGRQPKENKDLRLNLGALGGSTRSYQSLESSGIVVQP